MRMILAAFAALLLATQAMAADVRNFTLRGGTGSNAYEGTVSVTTLPTNEQATLFMGVEWNIGGFVIKGYGVVAKDEPTLLTVSFKIPAGLGVARYQIQPDGNVTGTLVGEKGFFVQEVWTYQESQ